MGTKTETAVEKAKELLKSKGKDPEKILSKDTAPTPESQDADAASSTEKQKAADDQTKTKEQQDQERRASEARKAEADEKARRADDDKLIAAKDETLSEEQRKKKKEALLLRETEAEAKKEAKLQKRFDDLTGQIKAAKAERDQDKQLIAKLEKELNQLKGAVERHPEKEQAELKKIEGARLAKYAEEDKELPREQRREMSKEELEEWLVEDMVAAQEWLADRQIRRREERSKDGSGEVDQATRAEADRIIRKQAESRAKVEVKHPELNITKRVEELRSQGKTPAEIQQIVFKENPKVKTASEIIKEHPEFEIAEDGPELLAAEMEKRLAGGNGRHESDADRDARIAAEAAEAERQRQADIDADVRSTRGNSGEREESRDPLYKQQLDIWKKQFPHLSEAEVKARLDKRLKNRREIGVA